VARKVLRHFPFVPRLAHMYNTLNQAELMVWHHHNCSQDGLVQHATDSHQWNFVKAHWPNFTMEFCNVRLGPATNGVNPFGVQRCN
jgi:hypothetical protein